MTTQYYGIHLWNISDDHIIQQILHSNVGDRFMSDPFAISHLTCKLLTYPNGKSNDDKGSLLLFLSLCDIPKQWQCTQLTFNWSLKCMQSMCQVNGISTFPNIGNKPKILKWSKHVLQLQELQQMYTAHKLNSITFEVTINILHIQQKSNHIFYQFAPDFDLIEHAKQSNKTPQVELSWHIDGELMQQFKRSYHGKRFSESISICNMWSIGCFPCGFNAKWNGFMSVSLHLNHMPPNVSKMLVELSVQCPQIEYEKKRMASYSLQKQHFGIVDFCESKYLKHLDAMDFVVLVSIHAVFDMHGRKVTLYKKSEKPMVSPTEQLNDDDVQQANTSKEVKEESLDEQKRKLNEEMIKLQRLRQELEAEREELQRQRASYLNVNQDKKQHDEKEHEAVNETLDKSRKCEVKWWLQYTVNLPQYVENFLLHGFDDMEVIANAMNLDDLQKIGVQKLGHQKKILLHIEKLRQKSDADCNTKNDENTHIF